MRITHGTKEICAMMFGHFLVEKGFCTPENVAEALARKAGGDPRILGRILVESGAMSLDQAKQAVAQYPVYEWDNSLWE